MASLASCLFQPSSHKELKVSARWTTKLFFLVFVFYRIGHTCEAVLPSEALRAEDSGMDGLHVKSSMNAAYTGPEKAATIGSSEKEPGLLPEEIPRARGNSHPTRVHPVASMEKPTERQKLEASPAQVSKSQSVHQAEADAKQKDKNNVPKTSFVPDDQDEITASLRGLNFDNDEAYEMFTLDYRAKLVNKMKEQGPNARRWLDELQVPADSLQRIHDDWSSIKSAAWDDYKLVSRGRIREMLLRWLYYFIFWSGKGKEERIHSQFLKIRMASASARSEDVRAVLELDLVRRGGYVLSKEELKLIEHTANASGDIEKLTPKEKKLIKELPKRTLRHRRLAETAELMRHFADLQKGVEDSKLAEVITGLAALDDKAMRRASWTTEETNLVRALRKVKAKDQIDRALNADQRVLLKTLVNNWKIESEKAHRGPLELKENEVVQVTSNAEKRGENVMPGALSTSGPQPGPQEAKIEKDADMKVVSEIRRDDNHPSASDTKQDESQEHTGLAVNKASSGDSHTHQEDVLTGVVKPEEQISRGIIQNDEKEVKPRKIVAEVHQGNPMEVNLGRYIDGESSEEVKIKDITHKMKDGQNRSPKGASVSQGIPDPQPASNMEHDEIQENMGQAASKASFGELHNHQDELPGILKLDAPISSGANHIDKKEFRPRKIVGEVQQGKPMQVNLGRFPDGTSSEEVKIKDITHKMKDGQNWSPKGDSVSQSMLDPQLGPPEAKAEKESDTTAASEIVDDQNSPASGSTENENNHINWGEVIDMFYGPSFPDQAKKEANPGHDKNEVHSGNLL